MVCRVEVFGGVLVLGRIAATNVSTFEADAQVYLCISGFQAVLAAVRAWGNLLYLVKMCTLCSQSVFPFLLPAAAIVIGGRGHPDTRSRKAHEAPPQGDRKGTALL